MSVNAVTARSAGGLVAATPRVAQIHRFPLRGKFLQQHRLRVIPDRIIRKDRPSIVEGRRMRARLYRQGLKKAQQKAARRALVKLALKLLGKKAFGIGSEAVLELSQRFYTYTLDPEGFPGWGNFPENWTSNAGTVWPGKVLGTYTANGFDKVAFWTSTALNLIDISDGSSVFGFRYWGHYESDPMPNGAPGIDWETQTQPVPEPVPVVGRAPRARTIYRKLENLSVRSSTRWTPRSNFEVRIGPRVQKPFRQNVPRKRALDTKAKPANQFVYLVLKRFANAGGEVKEWTDIFAEATGYIKGSMMLPERLRDTGLETQAKLYWLFVVAGLDFLDWEELAVLVLYNAAEDAVFGFMGELSKSAAQSLGMTVGPQTGLVM